MMEREGNEGETRAGQSKVLNSYSKQKKKTDLLKFCGVFLFFPVFFFIEETY